MLEIADKPAVARDRRGDQRNTERHGFEKCDTHAFLPRWKNEQIGRSKDVSWIWARRRASRPPDPGQVSVQGLNLLFQHAPLRSFADQRSTGPQDTWLAPRARRRSSVSSPFSGASRPTKAARGQARQSRPALPGEFRNRDAVGNRHNSRWFVLAVNQFSSTARSHRPGCQASRSSCSMALEIDDEGIRPSAAAADRAAKIAPRLPGNIAGRTGPFRTKHHRKPQSLPCANHTVSIVLEHRHVRQVDRVLLKPSRQIVHVAPRSPESQPRGFKSRNR